MLIFVGDGPYKGELKERCPDALFVGYKTASELSEYYANADLLVFFPVSQRHLVMSPLKP